MINVRSRNKLNKKHIITINHVKGELLYFPRPFIIEETRTRKNKEKKDYTHAVHYNEGNQGSYIQIVSWVVLKGVLIGCIVTLGWNGCCVGESIVGLKNRCCGIGELAISSYGDCALIGIFSELSLSSFDVCGDILVVCTSVGASTVSRATITRGDNTI